MSGEFVRHSLAVAIWRPWRPLRAQLPGNVCQICQTFHVSGIPETSAKVVEIVRGQLSNDGGLLTAISTQLFGVLNRYVTQLFGVLNRYIGALYREHEQAGS